MKIRPAACIIRNNKILLMRYEYNGKSVYNLPGGNRENGETISDTLVREMIEELGVIVKINEMILVAEVIQNAQKNDVLHCVFNCEIIENEPIINEKETSAIEIAWVELEKISQINLYPNVAKSIVEKLNNPNLSAYIGRIDQPWH